MKDVQQFMDSLGVIYTDSLELEDPAILPWRSKIIAKRRQNREIARADHWTFALFSDEFLQNKIPKLAIQWVSSLVGYGVYAKEDIRPLTYVGHYAGVVRKSSRDRNRDNDYVFRYLESTFRAPFVIDAKEKGNITRFINHSDSPNLLSKSLIIQDEFYVVFHSKVGIASGEQLTYDYGPYYWKKRSLPLTL